MHHKGKHLTREECGHPIVRSSTASTPRHNRPRLRNDHHERNIRGDNPYAQTAEVWINTEGNGVETGMDAMTYFLTAHGAYTQLNFTWEYEKNDDGSWKMKKGKRVRIRSAKTLLQIVSLL